MFGSTEHVVPERPDVMGVRRESTDTNQAARVLPYWCGTRWVGVTWLGDAWDVETTEIQTSTGKKKITTGHNYYASVCGLVGAGVGDRLTGIIFNEKTVWTGSYERGDEDYISITVENFGVIHFFWGTETQDTLQIMDDSGLEFSPMRGQMFMVGERLYFGADTTSAPNIQFRISRWPRPGWMTDSVARIGNDANPVACLWDWWTNKRFGLGRDESRLNTTRLAAIAEQLNTEGIGVSPLLTSPAEIKTLMTRLLEHIDGYPSHEDGKLSLQLARPATGQIPTLGFSDIISDPSIDWQSWEETFDQINVKFPDDTLNGDDNQASRQDPANFRITRRHRSKNVERPWFTSASVAQTIAEALTRVSSTPQCKGSLTALERSVRGIVVGSVFRLTTRDSQTLTLRCTERTEPEPGRSAVSLSFELDRGWANDDFAVPEIDTIPETTVHGVNPAAAQDFLNAPYALCSEPTKSSLIYMVARGDNYTTAFEVFRALADRNEYKASSPLRFILRDLWKYFSVKAKFSVAYSADTLTVDQYIGITFEIVHANIDLLDDEWDLEAGLNHELLAFCGTDAVEIMSLFSVTKLTATTYSAKCVRSLYDTVKKAHAINDVIWLQLRSKLHDQAWPPFMTDARKYKIQTWFNDSRIDIDTVSADLKAENNRTGLAICPPNFYVNGDAHHAYWDATGELGVSWTLTARAATVPGVPFGTVFASDLTAIYMEFWSADEVTYLGWYRYNLATQTGGIPISTVTAMTGSNDFVIYAWGEINGARSLNHTTTKVDRI